MTQEQYNRVTQLRIGKEFRKVVRGRNFMTPILVTYEKIKNGVCEISKNKDRNPENFGGGMYGVTVVQNGEHNYEKSKALHSIKEVWKYVKSLK